MRSYPGQDWVEVTIQSPLSAKDVRSALKEYGVIETEGKVRITVEPGFRDGTK